MDALGLEQHCVLMETCNYVYDLRNHVASMMPKWKRLLHLGIRSCFIKLLLPFVVLYESTVPSVLEQEAHKAGLR